MSLLNEADLIVAHNAAFDWKFISREMELCGQPLPAKLLYCTMTEFRARGFGVRAGLTSAAGFFGLERQGRAHGALEDAWLAMGVYRGINTPLGPLPFSVLPDPGFKNAREVPPRPDGPLPRRKRRSRKT
jgi:DNA polymerase-3 subunit epsilon